MDPLHILYETTLGDGGDGGGEPAAEAAPPGEPAPEGEPAAEPAQEPAVDPYQQAMADFEDMLEARLAQIQPGPQFQPPIPGATPGPMTGIPLPEYDPFDPESVQAYNDAREVNMLARMSMLIDQKFGPVAETLEQAQAAQQAEQGEEYIQDVLEAEVSRGDDLTDEGKGAIRSLFDVFMEQNAQRYGVSPRSAELSAQQAVEYIRSIEAAAIARSQTQQTNHLATLAGAKAEPGAAVVSTLPGEPARPRSDDEIIARWQPLIQAEAHS